MFTHFWADEQGLARDGKGLQNSTGKTLSLKTQHTKYVQKRLKIMQKCQNVHTKMQKPYKKRVQKP